MTAPRPRHLRVALLLAVALAGSSAVTAFSGIGSSASSVVKIYVTFQREDYTTPWQGGRSASGMGTGFVIDKRRILTNAHIVSDARFIQVQKDGESRRYRAKVGFIGHDCDLATLDVEDEAFFAGTKPVKFAKTLPSLNDEVTVLGYPLGGDRLSVTRGIVSRIDYSIYTHSSVDHHLVLQVDAAINPGNSGGPILYKGDVVGLAFQGLAAAENIGYGIPVPVINHFLVDISDGVYHGYPELGAFFLDTRNSALRRSLGLPDDNVGVVIYHIDPFGSAVGYIQSGDVLLSTDGYPIASDGTIRLDGNSVIFAELIERKQWGESIAFEVWRNKTRTKITVPLRNPDDPFVYRNIYDRHPEYFVVGGLVFSPLNREYLKVSERASGAPNAHELFYYAEYAKIDGMYKDREEFVVLIRRLSHEVNTYTDAFLNGIVTEINGVTIRSLKDVQAAVKNPQGGFHVMKFAGIDDTLVLDAKATEAAGPDISASYGVSVPEYFEEKKK